MSKKKSPSSEQSDMPPVEQLIVGFYRDPTDPDDGVLVAAKEVPSDPVTLGLWIAALIDTVLDVADAPEEDRESFAERALAVVRDVMSLDGDDADDADD